MVRITDETTTLEKAGLGLAVLGLSWATLETTLQYCTTGTSRRGSYLRVLKNSLIHKMMSTINVGQVRLLLKPIPVEKELAKHAHRYRDLNNYNGSYEVEGANARWLVEAPNRTKSDPVFLYIHGGGYVFKTDSSQIKYMAKLYRLLGNERLSILCVDYSVTPQNVYPDQLKEGVAIYKKLTEVDGCDRVIIFGDSCGCNLGIALMALSKHANKDFSEPIEPLKPAYGAILCSPWVNLQAEPAGSYVKQKDTDILSLEMLNYWGEFFCADETTRKSVWVSPVNSESSHWEGAVPADNTFVIWGEDEVMKDDCKKWAETAGVKHVYEEPESVHDCVLSGIKTPATAAIIEFCHDILHV